MRLDVLYVISQGFSARMILHSDVMPELKARGLSVGAVVPDPTEPAMKALASDLGIMMVKGTVTSPFFNRHADMLRRYLFEDVMGNKALRAKHIRDLASHNIRVFGQAKAYGAVNRLSRKLPVAKRFLERAQSAIYRNRDVERTLKELAPRVVVICYPINALECLFTAEAKRLGILTATQLLSWDNITCKGRFPVVSDRFISWGPIMSKELQEHYKLGDAQISNVGVPHFDTHTAKTSHSLTHQMVSGLGLDPQRPYILFGMSSPYFAPREIDIVEKLAQWVSDDRFGAVQLIVRPHPQNVVGHMADSSWVDRLKRIQGLRVGLDLPRIQQSKLPWSVEQQDLIRLGSLLRGAAVTINSGSTFSIDAILHDRPVVITAFDGDDTTLPWWQSARRCIEYPHLEKLVALGGVRVVQTNEAFASAIASYLKDPSLDHEGRSATRFEECGLCDGGAAKRTADTLVNWLSERQP